MNNVPQSVLPMYELVSRGSIFDYAKIPAGSDPSRPQFTQFTAAPDQPPLGAEGYYWMLRPKLVKRSVEVAGIQYHPSLTVRNLGPKFWTLSTPNFDVIHFTTDNFPVLDLASLIKAGMVFLSEDDARYAQAAIRKVLDTAYL